MTRPASIREIRVRSSHRPLSKDASPELRSTYLVWEGLIARYRQWIHEGSCEGDPPIDLRWVASFDRFVEDMGLKPQRRHIARKDRSAPFGPGNCFWGVVGDGGKRGPKPRWLVTHNHRTLTVNEWAYELGVSPSSIYNRLYRGLIGAAALGIQPSEWREE